jgi:hypothetical protein
VQAGSQGHLPLLHQRSSAPVRLLILDQVCMCLDGHEVRLDTHKEVLESVLRDVPRQDDDCSFVAMLRFGDELLIAHLRYRLEERPDHECAITPPKNPVDAPPDDSTQAWVGVRPCARAFGRTNGG